VRVLADGSDDVRTFQQATSLELTRAVFQVRVVEDLLERAPELVLPDDVGGELILAGRAREEGRERVPKEAREPPHEGIVSLCAVKQASGAMRFAERVVHGLDDDGSRQEIVIWIERRRGALWAVGRAINPRHRSVPEPLPDDYVFEGYELGDALDAANTALRDDLAVSRDEGVNEDVGEFVDEELLRPLERWFFGHPPNV
jgi:hypothetical protein